MASMVKKYTAVIQKTDDWWIGWVEEVNGAIAQERTRVELLISLRYAVEDLLEMDGSTPREIKFEVREVKETVV